jgi:hypothetical protein
MKLGISYNWLAFPPRKDYISIHRAICSDFGSMGTTPKTSHDILIKDFFGDTCGCYAVSIGK